MSNARTQSAVGPADLGVILALVRAGNLYGAGQQLVVGAGTGVVAGSVFVESVFAWPGMGRAMVQAIGARDYPVVLGATLLYAALVILANLAADLLLPALDPRRR